MKVYANRYGLIEGYEIVFALRAHEDDVRAARDARRRRATRRDAWRQRLLQLARVARRASTRRWAALPRALARAR